MAHWPILLILGIDILMYLGRALMNSVGNCIASAILARTTGVLLDFDQVEA
ncbi:MAG TPA: hypothetical protein VK716_15750 [Terracidiphilus sp.]|nr:hypothetical protein [Terracidiphilus sp.]